MFILPLTNKKRGNRTRHTLCNHNRATCRNPAAAAALLLLMRRAFAALPVSLVFLLLLCLSLRLSLSIYIHIYICLSFVVSLCLCLFSASFDLSLVSLFLFSLLSSELAGDFVAKSSVDSFDAAADTSFSRKHLELLISQPFGSAGRLLRRRVHAGRVNETERDRQRQTETDRQRERETRNTKREIEVYREI